MAHNINYHNGKYSFFSAKEVPWHKLGTVTEQALTSEEAIKAANLDREVIKVETYAKFPTEMINNQLVDMNGKPVTSSSQRGVKLPKTYATVMKDSYHVLGTVGKDYEVIQNIELFNFIDDMVGQKLAIFETAGALGDGEVVFITLKLPSFMLFNGDQIDNYILLKSSHDGSSQVDVIFTPVRVVCNNTLSMAMRDKNTADYKISFRHTKNVRNKMANASVIFNRQMTYSTDLSDYMEYLSKIPITDKSLNKIVSELVFGNYSVYEEDKKDSINFLSYNDIMNYDKFSTKAKNQFFNILNWTNQGAGQDTNRGTALWLYNGINGYYHNGAKYKDDADRFTSLYDGTSFKKMTKSIDLISQLV